MEEQKARQKFKAPLLLLEENNKEDKVYTMTEANNKLKKNSPLKTVGGMLNYKWIVNNIRFFLFAAALAVLYIANGHMADNRIRKISETSNKLKDLQYEYKTLKSEMMFKSRESEMVKAATPLGLMMDSTSPYRIKKIER